MSDVRYSEEHEWISVDGDVGTVGITDYAQGQLGDVVFVELPEVGKAVEQGDEAGVVESVKAASEVYAPVAGEILEVNETLEGNPGLVNEDATGEGWMFRIRIADAVQLDDLMSEEDYAAFVKDLE